jgi:hypothetical protein
MGDPARALRLLGERCGRCDRGEAPDLRDLASALARLVLGTMHPATKAEQSALRVAARAVMTATHGLPPIDPLRGPTDERERGAVTGERLGDV